MRKIYIAKRVSSNTLNDAFVKTSTDMDANTLVKAYQQKTVPREGYIHNGHWILRSVSPAGSLGAHTLPATLTPQHIMHMVTHKLDDSDALVAIVNTSAYGTIAELGYAVGTKRHAVYVLPDRKISTDQLEDLWMSFHLAFLTAQLWTEEDIQTVAEFKEAGILSINDYRQYVLSIIPKFLKS